MKKLLLVLIPSMLLISCSEKKQDNTEVVVVVETTTTTTIPVVLPVDEPVIQVTPTTNAVTPQPTTNTGNPVFKPLGGVIGNIDIPSIGVSWAIREGIDLTILNKSPGHYPHSPKPCRAGNAAIAGHRTTYGAPFNQLDLLKEGDVINITTPEGDCTYRYLRTEIVSPTNVVVVMPKGGNFLTLTACHPKGSAKQRIAVTAILENVVVK